MLCGTKQKRSLIVLNTSIHLVKKQLSSTRHEYKSSFWMLDEFLITKNNADAILEVDEFEIINSCVILLFTV